MYCFEVLGRQYRQKYEKAIDFAKGLVLFPFQPVYVSEAAEPKFPRQFCSFFPLPLESAEERPFVGRIKKSAGQLAWGKAIWPWTFSRRFKGM